ncbi:hypothetical protein B0T22DRAFT_498744 [Podospora appendiculata]|uniref:Uncharacterized protein n=1 Tax=Podospora appendiculata TaxID=314037 RepID=A0AAE0XAP7_9PEZI|nr:hypothetical protein B0T22DRAFT_498744 [Podospora appendiculata]
MGSHGVVDPTHAVDGLVRAMRDLTADTNYKLVADVFSEFIFLKDRNDRLSNSHREVLDQYRDYRNDLEDHKSKLHQEKVELEGVIQDKIQETFQLSAAKARLEADLTDTTADLEKTKHNAAEAAEIAAKEFAELQAAKAQELADLQASKEQELSTLQASKEEELSSLQASKEQELSALQASKEQELSELQTSKEQELAALQASKEQELADLQALKTQELTDLQAAKEAVEEAKKNAEEAAATAAAIAAGEIEVLTGTKTELEAWKAQAEIDAAQAAEDIAGLQADKAGLEEVKANNEAEIATLKETIARLEEEKKAVEDALEAANAEIASLQATLAEKKSEIEALQESMRAAEEQIASLQQTVEEKDGQIENLHGQLKTETERADNATAHGEDLQARLDDTELHLTLTSGKLADLEQYRLVLNVDNEDIYVTVLDKIWTTIVTLVEGTFRPDIDENILADPSCWTNLRNSPYLKHATQLAIPLPQSNTPAAKGMRISAVLAILSRALHRHVFRPVYLLDDDDENLVKFLRALEDEDPSREAHMRSTLLCMMPERQVEQGARRVKTVVREVSWLVQHLLSALQFEAFCSGLEAACKLACEQWMRIQQAHMKVEPYFGPPYDDFDWQVLELPEFTEAAMNEEGLSRRLGGTPVDDGASHPDDAVMDGPLETVEAMDVASNSAAGDADAAFVQEDGGHVPGMGEEEEMEEGEIDPEEILLVVWPSMCSVENGDLMSITQGLVISKEQARPALEEVRSRSRLIPRPGSRRARTLSMPGQSRGSSPRGKAASFLANAMSAADASAVADGGPEDG